MDQDSFESPAESLTPQNVPLRRSPDPLAWLARWLYTSNPFYALSAALVFAGLWFSFAPVGGGQINTGALAGGLAGYTLLLAISALLLVRFGKVWDDARTLLLLVVLSLVGLSISFDDLLIADADTGGWLCAGGFALAVIVSEGLLRGLSIRLSWLFRGPYYLLLAVFFLYPAILGSMHLASGTGRLGWMLFGFPLGVSGALLALIPAAVVGPRLTRDSGTPWSWPWYPWTLFAMLALCACGRSYYVCMSFDFGPRALVVFGPYFLVPIWLASCTILLAGGLSARNHRLVQAALVAALAAVPLAAWHSPNYFYLQFLTVFRDVAGSPLFLSLMAVGLLCVVAAVCRVAGAIDGLTAVCVTSAYASPSSLLFEKWPSNTALGWILAAAGFQLALAIVRRSSARALIAYQLLALAAVYFTSFNRTWLVLMHGEAIAVCVVSLVFEDRLARLMLRLNLVLWTVFALASISDPSWPLGQGLAGYGLWYQLACLAILMLVAVVRRDWHYGAAAMGVLAVWFAVQGRHTYLNLRRHVVGVDYLIGGAAAFMAAVLVSLRKAGVTPTRVLHVTVERWQKLTRRGGREGTFRP